MIKKFRNWYCHLLLFQKIRLLGRGVALIVYLFLFFLLLPFVSSFADFCITIFLLCPYFAIVGYGLIYLFFRPDIAEAKYKENLRKQEQKAKLESWFSSRSCLNVAMKSDASCFDILFFYHQNHLLVNNFYLEQHKMDDKTLYSISADCQGVKDRVIFPDTIEDPDYLLAIFTLND